MIYALTIALIGTSVITILVAIIATFALRANSRLTREKNAAMRALEEALAGKEAPEEQNGRLQKEKIELKIHNANLFAERNDLEARNTALSKTLEAQPTAPKRVVRKNTSTPQTTEEARQTEQAARYNREMDERNRIAAENRDKPWLPLQPGE